MLITLGPKCLQLISLDLPTYDDTKVILQYLCLIGELTVIVAFLCLQLFKINTVGI
jgi:hypothetical protein